MALSGDNWANGTPEEQIWKEGYDRLNWRDQATINDLANKVFGGSQIEAMKARFKGNIAMALMGRLPKDWQLYSEEERKALQETSHDSALRESLKELLADIGGIDDTTPIDKSAIVKNSGPKKKG